MINKKILDALNEADYLRNQQKETNSQNEDKYKQIIVAGNKIVINSTFIWATITLLIILIYK